jgi:DNA-binding MarR family transcriptional regulator
MEIEKEISQKKFSDEFEKAEVNLIYTANWKVSLLAVQLKPHSISLQQFNILRILRGQGGCPAQLKLLTERMLDKMSNTSRLVEKLVQKGMVIRKSCKQNRRQVDILITEKGLQVCGEVSELINNHRKQHQRISEEEARELNRILNKLRG